MHQKIHIIGIMDDGPESLSRKALSIVDKAELLIGGKRHLAFFADHPAEKFVIKSNLAEAVDHIQKNLQKKIVVFASGDPLFYGIGKYLLSKLPPEEVEVVPAVTSLQMAFAKVKISWEDAFLLSVHAKPMEPLLDAVKIHDKIGLLTGGENTPGKIAQFLLSHGVTGFSGYVCENLGGRDERIVQGTLEEIAQQAFAPLNVMILMKNEAEKRRNGETEKNSLSHSPVLLFSHSFGIGIPDEEFFQRKPDKGLITKEEIRVLALSKMRLKPDSIVWDIGAGSGSVSIEASRLAPHGEIYAVEKNEEDIEIIKRNSEKFGTGNLRVIHAKAPEGLSDLKDPDAIFIGGSGGNMEPLIKTCYERLKPGGRLVINLITLDNLASAISSFKAMNLNYEANMVNISRSKEVLDLTRFEALNPIFLLRVEKVHE